MYQLYPNTRMARASRAEFSLCQSLEEKQKRDSKSPRRPVLAVFELRNMFRNTNLVASGFCWLLDAASQDGLLLFATVVGSRQSLASFSRLIVGKS